MSYLGQLSHGSFQRSELVGVATINFTIPKSIIFPVMSSSESTLLGIK